MEATGENYGRRLNLTRKDSESKQAAGPFEKISVATKIVNFTTTTPGVRYVFPVLLQPYDLLQLFPVLAELVRDVRCPRRVTRRSVPETRTACPDAFGGSNG